MIKVKLSFPGFQPNIDISQFTNNNNNVVDDCEFYINRDDIQDADFWFCFEGVRGAQEVCAVQRDRIIFLTGEVAWPRFYYDSILKVNFLRQFAKIYTCHDIYTDTVKYELPFLPWMINANHGSSIFEKSERDYNYFKRLSQLPKRKLISVFCSNQTWTEGHRLRLKFVRELKNHFGEKLDWFGNGLNQSEQKWDGIAPYKYHIVLENQSRNNVLTEKLYDSYLGLAFPIYYGAPNVSEYFNPRAFVSIDICDLNGSIKIIEDTINNDTYDQALPFLLASKNLVLDKYNVFKRIAKICSDDVYNGQHRQQPKENIVLRSLSQFTARSDLQDTLKNRKFRFFFDRLILYYLGHVFKKLSTYLISKYDNKY